MIFDSLLIDAPTFAAASGWEAKPEGMCKGERCVPVPRRDDGLVDVGDFARRLDMPVVHDERHGLWSVGPEGAGGKFLETAELPEIVLPDFNGNRFSVSSLRGQKVVMVAWASY